jgi:hypothetical protein
VSARTAGDDADVAKYDAGSTQPVSEQGVVAEEFLQGSATTTPRLSATQCHDRLHLACELLVQWATSSPLVSEPSVAHGQSCMDLEACGMALSGLRQLQAALPAFGAHADPAAAAIQQHAAAAYGLHLAPCHILGLL